MYVGVWFVASGWIIVISGVWGWLNGFIVYGWVSFLSSFVISWVIWFWSWYLFMVGVLLGRFGCSSWGFGVLGCFVWWLVGSVGSVCWVLVLLCVL